MPGRNIPLITEQIYHIINRGIAKQPIFNNKRDYQRFLEIIRYYHHKNTPIRYSKFLSLAKEERERIVTSLDKQKNHIIEILCYCLMPNHFHLVLCQIQDGGIAKFVGNISNSYTKYFNTKNKRQGPLLQGKFKAVRIEDDDQLLHLSRYIHLNPFTSYMVKKINDVVSYQYSSLSEYLNLSTKQIVNKKYVLSHFKTLKSYRNFIFDQAEYQKKIGDIKHLMLEN